MSTNVGLNVLRYSALAFGITYGFVHQRTIWSNDKVAAAKHEYDHKNQLIQQAKEEFARKKSPPPTSDIITNPEDPKFDLEKFLNKAAAS